MLVKAFLLFVAVGLASTDACYQSPSSDTCQCDYGKCIWWGDPHTRTFDGLWHHFQGNSGQSYRYVSSCTNNFYWVPFQVLTRHVACGWWPYVTCTDYVRLRLYNRFWGTFNRELRIDNNFVVTDVTNWYSPALGVKQYYGWGSYYVVTRTWNYVEVSVYTGRLCPYWRSRLATPDIIIRARRNMRRVEVQLNEYYKNLVCGLCGYWNGIPNDDFTWIYPPASNSPNCYEYSTSGLPVSMGGYSWYNWLMVNWFGYRWRDVGNRRLLQGGEAVEDIAVPLEPTDPEIEINVVDIDTEVATKAAQICEELFPERDDNEFCEICGEEAFLTCTCPNRNCCQPGDDDCLRQCILEQCQAGCVGEACPDDALPQGTINTPNECVTTAV